MKKTEGSMYVDGKYFLRGVGFPLTREIVAAIEALHSLETRDQLPDLFDFHAFDKAAEYGRTL